MRQHAAALGIFFQAGIQGARQALLSTKQRHHLIEVLVDGFAKLRLVEGQLALVVHLDADLEDGGVGTAVLGRTDQQIAHK